MIYTIEPNEFPPKEILEAAMKVENWMTMHGHKKWVLMGICSRNLMDPEWTPKNEATFHFVKHDEAI